MTDPSLAQILAQRMHAGEPIPVPAVMGILCQLCDGLHAGHSVNALHLNIAPHSLFIAGSGVVSMAAPGPQPQATPAYAAPEYVMMGMLDARADLWALGVLAYEMLTNRPLFFAGDDRATIDRVCNMPVAPPSSVVANVPADVDGIVMTALARDPSHRWQYAIVLRDQILAAAQRLGLDISPSHIAALLAAPMRPSAPAFPPVATPQPLHVPQPSQPPPGLSGGTKPMPAPAPPSVTAPMASPEPLPTMTKPMPASDRPPAGSKTTPDVWQDEENEETRMDAPPEAPEAGPFAKAPSAPRDAQPPPRVTRPSPLAASLAIPSGPLVDPKSPMAEAKTVLGEVSPVAGMAIVDAKSPAAEAKTVLGEASPVAGVAIVDAKSPAAAQTVLAAPSPVAGVPIVDVQSPAAPEEVASAIDSAPIPFEVVTPTPVPDLAMTPFELLPPQDPPPSEPHKPMRLNTQAFMLGPEPTQIGAKPLIDFGDASSLSSLVGEPARPSGPIIPAVSPAPKGTFVAPDGARRAAGRTKMFVIVGIAIAVLGAAVAVVVMYVL